MFLQLIYDTNPYKYKVHLEGKLAFSLDTGRDLLGNRYL